MRAYTNADLAKCARRELGQRKRVYPRLVEQGKMSQGKADEEISMMLEIAERFERLAFAEKPQQQTLNL